MKKTFLLLVSGFFLATTAVMGQEQQNEKTEVKKVTVSKSSETTLKSKTVTAKKVTINKTEAVQRKKVANTKAATRKEEK
jgi:hypothetical protein